MAVLPPNLSVVFFPCVMTRRWIPPSFPIGTDQFIDEFLQDRTTAIERLLTCMVRTFNIASPYLPIRHSMNCLHRSCIAQKCGHLLRAIPPDNTAKFSANIDEKLVVATEEIFKLEELGDIQKELLFMPPSRGWSGL